MEAWLPTIISGILAGLVVWFVKYSMGNLRSFMGAKVESVSKKADLVAERLALDEREYLTKESHGLICGENSKGIELHINKVMAIQRSDIDRKFEVLGRRLDELRDMIRNGVSKK